MEVGVDLTYLTYLVIIAKEVKIVKEVAIFFNSTQCRVEYFDALL